MIETRRLVRLATAAGATAGAAAYVLACGPFLTQQRPVETVRPGQIEPYARGELGIVREHFARRYLVQAYRRFTDRPPIAIAPGAPPAPAAAADPVEAWRQLHKSLTGAEASVSTDRDIGNYQSITNCLDDTFVSAAATARARASTFGPGSAGLGAWMRAQDAVLANCSGDALSLPDPAPAGADALTRGDRAYQTAAAYFYAMRYDEAAERFRQIGADTASPWRPYGRYLAGRALLRQATTGKEIDRGKLTAAQTEFRAVLADAGAAALQKSASGLLDLIAFRLDPTQRLRDLSTPIATGESVTAAQLNDYERLLNLLLGDTTSYDYAGVANRDALARTADVNDWIMVMQGTGDAAAARAVAEWKRTSATPWLVAALWKIPATHADGAALLAAAAKVPAASPAFMTAAFLRVRLLVEKGEADRARTVLAALPRKATGPGDAEAVNLLNAERFMLAQSLTQLLETAPRLVVSQRGDADPWNGDNPDAAPGPLARAPVFDEDAAGVFNTRLPLARLVEAATSTALPARLRLRVAAAAFTRAWLLDRADQALAVAPVLRTLAPLLAADVSAFTSAPAADRHRAGLRLILRTPGLHADVMGLEDDQEYNLKGPSRAFDHTFRRNWWCGFSAEWDTSLGWARPDSQVVTLLYRSAKIDFPSFLSADERTAVQREHDALAALGPAPNYLATEAVTWAKARPSDLDAAEALAHAVEGTRWACGDDKTTVASRAAFETLHQLFPKSEWALKTKYWY